jgi:hypothetical protein
MASTLAREAMMSEERVMGAEVERIAPAAGHTVAWI